jgi:hypothetical protein
MSRRFGRGADTLVCSAETPAGAAVYDIPQLSFSFSNRVQLDLEVFLRHANNADICAYTLRRLFYPAALTVVLCHRLPGRDRLLHCRGCARKEAATSGKFVADRAGGLKGRVHGRKPRLLPFTRSATRPAVSASNEVRESCTSARFSSPFMGRRPMRTGKIACHTKAKAKLAAHNNRPTDSFSRQAALAWTSRSLMILPISMN